MRYTIALSASFFNTQQMLTEYVAMPVGIGKPLLTTRGVCGSAVLATL
jgi:hypothetical protein